jgi:hypothetical protein
MERFDTIDPNPSHQAGFDCFAIMERAGVIEV